MADATRNCCHPGACSVYNHTTMHQFTASLYLKPQTQGACIFSCNLPSAVTLAKEWLGSVTLTAVTHWVEQLLKYMHTHVLFIHKQGKLHKLFSQICWFKTRVHSSLATMLIQNLNWMYSGLVFSILSEHKNAGWPQQSFGRAMCSLCLLECVCGGVFFYGPHAWVLLCLAQP